MAKANSLLAMALLLLHVLLVPTQMAHAKAVYGIGMRIVGDQLLMKDVLKAPPVGTDESPVIHFNYAIPEQITYIEILSKENVQAAVNFSYQNDLVVGSVTATGLVDPSAGLPSPTTTNAAYEDKREHNEAEGDENGEDDDEDEADEEEREQDGDEAEGETTTPPPSTTISSAPRLRMPSNEPLQIVITIYGFNRTMLNVSPALILNRDQHFRGQLEPRLGDADDDDDGTDGGGEDDDLTDFDDGAYDDEDDEQEAHERRQQMHSTLGWEDELADPLDGDGLNDFDHTDKVIEVGARQSADYLLYETHQISSSRTELPTNHSVTFYYADSNLITYVQFVIFDHFAGKTATEYVPPTAEYTHYSPTTLKAVITDHETNSLFVQMSVYGYRPQDLPVTYVPFLLAAGRNGGSGSGSGKEAPMPPLQRLKMLLNAAVGSDVTTVPAPRQEDETQNGTKAGDDDDEDENDNNIAVAAADRGDKECDCPSAATALSTVVMQPLDGGVRTKTLWMVALSLLQLFTAQPRAV